MARTIEITKDKLYVGYDYSSSYYYVTHRETTTKRLSAEEAFNIIGVLSPSSAVPQLLNEIKALSTIAETLTNIYFAYDDEGLGIRAVWFNSYKEYPILYDGKLFRISGTDIVFPIDSYFVKSRMSERIVNFYKAKIGLTIPQNVILSIYDYLTTYSSNKPVYNKIKKHEKESDPYYFSNILATSDTSKVIYTITQSTEEKWEYDTLVGNIESISSADQEITLFDSPDNISVGDKIKIEESSDGTLAGGEIYTVKSMYPYALQDQTYSWHNGDDYPTAYNYLENRYESEEVPYKKEILLDNPNFALIGTGVRVDGEGTVSNFGTSNYARLSKIPVYSGKKLEIKMKFHTGSTVANDTIWGSQSYSMIMRLVGGVMSFWLSGDGSSWNIISSSKGSYVFTADTDYWVKLTWDGSVYNFYYSTDDITYKLDKTWNSTVAIYSREIQLGKQASETDTYFRGSIYMPECYVKFNNKYWWKGYDAIQYKEIEEDVKVTTTEYEREILTGYIKSGISNYYMLDTENKMFRVTCSNIDEEKPNKITTNLKIKVAENITTDYNQSEKISSMDASDNSIILTGYYDNTKLKQGAKFNVQGTHGLVCDYINVITAGAIANYEGVLSDFSSTNFADLPTNAFSTASSWQINFKFNFRDNTAEQTLISTTNGSYPFRLTVNTTGKLRWWMSSGTSSWNIVNGSEGDTVLSKNKDYWLRIKFTGTQYTLDYSTDGVSYIREMGFNSSLKLHANANTNIRLGAYGTGTPLIYGSIDLNECSILINNKVTWTGVTFKPHSNDGIYTVNRTLLKDSLYTAIIPYEKIEKDYKAPVGGPYPRIHMESEATITKGKQISSVESMMLNVIKSKYPDKFPVGEFLLDDADQLTQYLNMSNSYVAHSIPIPTEENWSRMNDRIPKQLNVQGLSMPLEFKGLYTELFK